MAEYNENDWVHEAADQARDIDEQRERELLIEEERELAAEAAMDFPEFLSTYWMDCIKPSEYPRIEARDLANNPAMAEPIRRALAYWLERRAA